MLLLLLEVVPCSDRELYFGGGVVGGRFADSSRPHRELSGVAARDSSGTSAAFKRRTRFTSKRLFVLLPFRALPTTYRSPRPGGGGWGEAAARHRHRHARSHRGRWRRGPAVTVKVVTCW